MIFLGEAEFLSNQQISDVNIISNHFRGKLEELDYLFEHGDPTRNIIAVHGGGSFGLLWPGEEYGRNLAINLAIKYNCTFVQFPQSINFSQGKNYESLYLIRSHSKSVICVRDKNSLQLANKEFANVLLIPDMWHCFSEKLEIAPGKKRVVIKRNDVESNDDHRLEIIQNIDWLKFTIKLGKAVREKRSVLYILSFAFFKRGNMISLKTATNISRFRFFESLKSLSEVGTIYTDRLHASLLSIRLGLRFVIVDDKYSKIESYFDTWYQNYSPLIFSTWREAFAYDFTNESENSS